MPPITPEEEKLAEDALFGQGSGDEAGESQSWAKPWKAALYMKGRRLALQCGGDPEGRPPTRSVFSQCQITERGRDRRTQTDRETDSETERDRRRATEQPKRGLALMLGERQRQLSHCRGNTQWRYSFPPTNRVRAGLERAGYYSVPPQWVPKKT